MRFGIFVLAGRFPGQDVGDALRRSMDAVADAEAAGFDDAWMAEHHFMSYGTCPSAVTFAAHALGRTSSITLGTAVSVLSTTHPVSLAEQVTLVDQMSGGRFRLGVGRGGPWVDLEVFGTGLDHYEHGFPESLDLLLDCLTRQRVSAHGPRFSFREVPVVPPPYTRPHTPVAVACTSRQTVELAAARGLPMLLGMHIGDADKAALVAHYAEQAARAGHDPDSIAHVSTVLAYVADDRGRAERELRASMPGWLATAGDGFVPVDGRERASRDPTEYADLLCSLHPVGSPQDCVERMRESAERTGIEHVIMLVEGGGTRERTAENIARLGAEVLPRLRGGPDPTAPGALSRFD